MFTHVMLGASDMAASRAFYDAALGALGVPPGEEDEKGRVAYTHRGGRFMLTRPLDGEPATGANGGTIGFFAETIELADAFHAAGLAHGGTAIEDPPGIRHATGGRELYIAYLRDPSGNKVCATHPVKA